MVVGGEAEEGARVEEGGAGRKGAGGGGVWHYACMGMGWEGGGGNSGAFCRFSQCAFYTPMCTVSPDSCLKLCAFEWVQCSSSGYMAVLNGSPPKPSLSSLSEREPTAYLLFGLSSATSTLEKCIFLH